IFESHRAVGNVLDHTERTASTRREDLGPSLRSPGVESLPLGEVGATASGLARRVRVQVSSNLETLTLFIEASPYRARASRPLPEGEGDTTLLSASRQRRQAALVTGRYIEAGYILRTFSYYVDDGLIPTVS